MKRQGVPFKKYSVGLGYIIIPAQVDRDVYVKNCLNREKVHILTIDGELNRDCLIDKDKIQQLEFPEKEGEYGSVVVFINDFLKGAPIIIGVLNNGSSSQLLKEHEFKISKKSKNSSVNISGRGDNGDLFINVSSSLENGGNVYLDVNNKQKKSKLIVKVSGDVRVEATSKIEIMSNEGIHLGSKELEPSVLGNKLKEFLDDFIDELSKITVSTSIGTQPIINKVQVTNFKNRTEELLSTLNKIQ